jgi:shikimate dehydrogenase
VRLFGLIGFPLTHSFSEKYFAEKFRRENIADASYRLFPIDTIEKLPELISSHPGLVGLNVTIPYKEKVIPFLDELDETAQAVGAVNTILISYLTSQVSRLKGFNTDVHGFRQSIKPFLTSSHERALILGTGGASKAVEYVLKQIGVDCIFVSREKKGKSPNGQVEKIILTYEELNPYVIDSCKLIVNCSPAGTFPNVNEFPKLPYEAIGKEHLLYDLVYNPAETAFLKKGKANGAQIMNGLDMLKMQAEKAWDIWNSR